MPLQPLTHHEIVGLVEPFTRNGRHIDLAASDRLERRIAFKSVEHGGGAAAAPALRETLQLESLENGRFRLSRVLTLANGLDAMLEAEGTNPGELLAHVEAIAPQRQFRSGPGYLLVLSHRLEQASGTPPARLFLTRGVAEIGGLMLTLSMSSVRNAAADIELADASFATLDLPEDLLAVLGWSWARITRTRTGWNSSLRLRGSGAARGEDAEAKLEKSALHLAQTLAEPPGRFHPLWVWARWRVFLRRATPLLACIGLVAGVMALPRLELSDDSVIRMLIFNAPPILLMLVFCMREMPRIEIPPWPRPSMAAAWRGAQTGGADAALAGTTGSG